MTAHAWTLLAVYGAVLIAVSYPLGTYLADCLDAGPSRAAAAARTVLGPVEQVLYRFCGIRAEEEMDWKRYALAILLFSFFGALAVYALQRLQSMLPLNPQALTAVGPDSSFNTAVSFVTNTNWQGYAGETTMSYLTQMLGLAVQNFLSAATGIAVAIALIRGIARHGAATIGNAWVDLTRITLYALLPISFFYAVFLIGQGVIQNFSAYKDVHTVEVTTYQAPTRDASGQPVKDAHGNPVDVAV